MHDPSQITCNFPWRYSALGCQINTRSRESFGCRKFRLAGQGIPQDKIGLLLITRDIRRPTPSVSPPKHFEWAKHSSGRWGVLSYSPRPSQSIRTYLVLKVKSYWRALCGGVRWMSCSGKSLCLSALSEFWPTSCTPSVRMTLSIERGEAP
jgi:hypothetical protein